MIESANSTSLTNLPAELLYKIFEHLGHRDLLSLAKLCQRLNAVGLQQSYKLVNLNVDKGLLYLGSSALDTLNALLLDVSCPRFTYITTCFDTPDGPIVARLHAYLRMLPSGSVQTFEIQFPTDTLHVAPKAFSGALSHLLGSACLQNCETLKFSYLDKIHCRRPNTVHISSPPLRSINRMRLFRSAGHIHSRFHDWLIQSANSSRLTNLFLDGTDLNIMLEQLRLPYLKILFLSSPNLSARDVSSFITKHPFITHLHFHRCHWSNTTVVAPDTLPHLESLSASPSIVLPLLAKCRRHRLMTVSIEFDRPTKMAAKIIKLLHLISDHPALSHLTFNFTDRAVPDLWAQPWWWLEDGLRFPKIPQIDIDFWFTNEQPDFSLLPRWVRLFPDLNRLKIKSTKLTVLDGFALVKSFEENRVGFLCFRLTCAAEIINRWLENQVDLADRLQHFVALRDADCYGNVKVVISSS